jgi:hypothetical protein
VKEMTVRDLMTSKDEYVILSDSSSLYEAIIKLKQEQAKKGGLAHTTVLIQDQAGKIVSQLNIFDVMRGIEPKYKKVSGLNRVGISNDLVESIFKDSAPWAMPLNELCSKAPKILVRDIMPEISKAESIQVNDDLNRAMHKMIVNQLDSLIVFDDEKNIVGLIRSIDLFNLLRSLVEECKLDQS